MDGEYQLGMIRIGCLRVEQLYDFARQHGVHLAVYLVYHQAFTIIQRVNNGIRQLEIFHRSFRLVAFKWE